MRPAIHFGVLALAVAFLAMADAACFPTACEEVIQVVDPPEKDFFSKRLDYEGIPIKAHKDVDDRALCEGRHRLDELLGKVPGVRQRLGAAGAELHIIGRNQVTSDLPEHAHMKGKPFDGALTIDERTRGVGGRLVSCGEENLLRLEHDRYRGRDICVHEFAHCIYSLGMPNKVRERFRQQYARSLAAGRWVGSYAGSNGDEFFAELSMWYWGTRGDLGMQGAKPADGRQGLAEYDAEALALLDDFYVGRLEEARRDPACRPARSQIGLRRKDGAIGKVAPPDSFLR